jgi:hypothetical protein
MSQNVTLGVVSANAGLAGLFTGLTVGLTSTAGIAFLILLITYIALAALLSQSGLNPMHWINWNPRNWCWNPVKWVTGNCGILSSSNTKIEV